MINIMKKYLPIWMSCIFFVVAFSVGWQPVDLQAATEAQAQLQVTGWLDYSSAYGMLYFLNQEREAQGLAKVEMDQSMMEAAVQYAEELTVRMDANRRSDGSQSYIERQGMRRWAGSFMDFAPEIEVAPEAKSVGIACFVADEVTYYYVIESTEAARQVADQPDDHVETALINLKGDYTFFISSASGDMAWNELTVGQTLPITLYVANDPARPDCRTSLDNDSISWRSNNTRTVNVENGKATGVAPGKTELVATFGSYTLHFPVYVSMCGEQVAWSYDETNQELTIEGRGDTFDYVRAPWHGKKISSVYLSEGITSLGDHFFYEADVASIQLPASLSCIGRETFGNHSAVNLYFLGNAPQIAEDSFKYTEAQAYFLENDVTWTDSVKQNYGGEIQWHIWDSNSNPLPPESVGDPLTSEDILPLSEPTITACRNTSKGVEIAWEGVPEAIGYDIFRKNAASWERVKRIGSDKAKWTNTSVSEGEIYCYQVCAIAEDGQTATAESASIYRLSSTKSFTAKRVSRKKIKVRWGVNKKATGYEVQYATNKDFTKNVKKISLKKNKLREKYVTDINKGKTYYVRVRSYKKVDGKKHYSAWTKAVKCK